MTLRQAARIAIPRRFSAPMHEIWWMQSRFGARQRKRVVRLLAHPRFRAAFDFLELRASVVPELADELAWWREAQGLEPESLVQKLASAPPTVAPSGKPKRRRRRSGGRKPPASGAE